MCGPWSQQVMEQILSMERQQQQQQPTLLAQMPPPISLHVLPSQEPTSQEAWHTHTHTHTQTSTYTYIFICMLVRLDFSNMQRLYNCLHRQ